MIKVQNGIATRAPLPEALLGLNAESLADLRWTDPALGLQDAAWWPAVDQSPTLGQYERYGAETLTADPTRQVVAVVRAVEPWPQSEIDAARAAAAARLQESVVRDTQARLDYFARTRSYDGILSACTYATSGVERFATEGRYAVQVRDETWATLYAILAQVQAGERPAPTGFADIEAELPKLQWPA